MLGAHLTLPQYLDACRRILLKVDHQQVHRLADDIFDTYRESRLVLLCGHGVSAESAWNICRALNEAAVDAVWCIIERAKPLRGRSLTDGVSARPSQANDPSAEGIFVERLQNVACPGDLLIALDISGDSQDVLEAAAWADRNGLKRWGVTGFYGGELRKWTQHTLRVPICDAGLVESIHLLLFHWIADELHARIGRTGRYAPDECSTREGTRLRIWPRNGATQG